MKTKVYTDIEESSEALRQIDALQTERQELIKYIAYCVRHGLGKEQKLTEYKIKAIKNEIQLLRDSIEYVRLKAFIEVCKTILSKQQFEEAWNRADAILQHPELYINKVEDEYN